MARYQAGQFFKRCVHCGRHAHLRLIAEPTRPGGPSKVECCMCGRKQPYHNYKERDRLIREADKRYYERNGRKPQKKRVQIVGQAAVDRYNALPALPRGLEDSLCFAYGRISIDEEESVSIQTQQMRIDEFYARELKPKGIKFYENGYFWDIGTSGGRLMQKRAAGAALLATLKRGDHVIISKVDRAYRDLEDAVRGVRQLKERGITAHFIDMPVLPDGAAGELVFQILAMAAEFERRRIGERTREALAYRRKMGQATGCAPLGWKQIGFKATARFIPDEEFRQVGEMIVTLRRSGLHWWDCKQSLVAMGLDRVAAIKNQLLRVKEIYCRCQLRWPRVALKQIPKKWLFANDELGLQTLAALDDQTLDATLRDREKVRQRVRAAWDAAAQAVMSEQDSVL